MKIGFIQMNSVPNPEQNLAYISEQLAANQSQLAGSLILLPECFAYFGGDDVHNLTIAEALGDGPIQHALMALAKQYHVTLIAGSMPILSDVTNKVKPMSIVFDGEGKISATYQKRHLFDVDVADSTQRYRESARWLAGDQFSVVNVNGVNVGMAICYDVRFPILFQKLRQLGADIILLPSAFTEKTGQAHWHTLIRARAIENQVFMLAANQAGVHQNGRETYGHSLVVDPWGEVLLDNQKQLGLSLIDIDLACLEGIRSAMPVLSHNRILTQIGDNIE